MAGEAINIGAIEADLDLKTGNLERGLARGRQLMEVFDKEISRLTRDLDAGAISLMGWTDRVNSIDRAVSSLAPKMRDAFGKIGSGNGPLDVFNKGMRDGQTSSRAFGAGLMQLGYVVDDVRYGFGAIVNNIGPLVGQLATGFGMAYPEALKLGAAAQVAAVGLYQLYERWGEVTEAFGNPHFIDRAAQSIHDLAEEVKKLKADAESFSWGDIFASAAGFNPDAGKGEKAANLDARLKARNAADANAKSLENEHTDAEKKAAERFKDAVAESGGMGKLVSEVAGKDLEDKGWAAFLSQNERNELNRMGGFRGTDAKGRRLDNDQSQMTEGERSRYGDLKGRAQREAMARARERIGGALYDPKAQAEIGERVGGDRGDLLAGKTLTEKEKDQKDKEAVRQEKEAAAEKNRQGAEAKRAQAEKDRTAKRLDDFYEADAREVEQNRKREQRESRKRAGELIPGLDEMAQRGVGMAMLGQMPMDKVGKAIEEQLARNGMEGEKAKGVAKEVVADAQKDVKEKAVKRALSGRGTEDESAHPALAMSEVVDSSQRSRQIQSGVSNGMNETKKQTTLQESIDKRLAELVQRPGLVVGVEN